jgi:hypothetical protein
MEMIIRNRDRTARTEPPAVTSPPTAGFEARPRRPRSNAAPNRSLAQLTSLKRQGSAQIVNKNIHTQSWNVLQNQRFGARPGAPKAGMSFRINKIASLRRPIRPISDVAWNQSFAEIRAFVEAKLSHIVPQDSHFCPTSEIGIRGALSAATCRAANPQSLTRTLAPAT